ncbi:MAG: aminomethyl-transferring glycine dehydrogenase subunit GcvPB [Spirochaetales bacterium]|uniref:glycine dehydrogenase (aminomethyl-transferring) n=1 Tax=Candidatus Thalassospirochaeta sargassi TaxID=3119039 RepID=A0AAJ1IDB5_9SPIO|nr:aminomethyl-transferring glycine dehydrogenase subunit GcvPB [Spirochaetales bacterium]
MELIFEKSQNDNPGIKLPASDVPSAEELDFEYLRNDIAGLPQISEPEVVRHFTNLSRLNFSVDTNFYPLGSCTMKYNPRFTEKLAGLDSFSSIHPLQPQLIKGGMLTQGAMQLIYNLENLLSEITGMHAFTTQPMAGAHGELTGVMLIAAYHKSRGDKREFIIIPDSGHGTNPASAAIAGYKVKTIKSDKNGVMDMQAYKEALDERTAGVMLTCPNTLGIFNPHIKEITDSAHKAGALMYYDGANMNAIMGKAKPGELGFDIVHLNLHKTFSTPHGGGGPGAGPVGVKEFLSEYLPTSRIIMREDGSYALDYYKPLSIGYISPFYGNFGILLRAYAYILYMGRDGLIEASENAVLNANYLKAKLKERFHIPHPEGTLHEFVISAKNFSEKGVKALDFAKAIIDTGFHPPTVYFPLNIKEAIMVEPTETESRQTLDSFVDELLRLADLADSEPSRFHDFPEKAPVCRPDEVRAVKHPNLSYKA